MTSGGVYHKVWAQSSAETLRGGGSGGTVGGDGSGLQEELWGDGSEGTVRGGGS